MEHHYATTALESRCDSDEISEVVPAAVVVHFVNGDAVEKEGSKKGERQNESMPKTSPESRDDTIGARDRVE